MGRHTTLVTEPTEQPIPTPFPEIEQPNQDDVLDLALVEFRSEGFSVEIRRLDPKNGRSMFVKTYDARFCSQEVVARESGGGSYEAKIRNAGGKIVARPRFEIDPRIQGELDKPAGDQKPQGQQIPVQFNSNDTAMQLLTKQAEQSNGQLIQMFGMMMTMQQQMMQQQMAAQTQMTQVLVAAMGARDGGGSSEVLAAVLPSFVELKKLEFGGGRGKNSVQEIRELFELGREFKSEFGGEGEQKDDDMGFGSILKAGLTMAAPMIQAHLTKGAMPQAQQPATMQVDTGAPAAQPQPPSPAEQVILSIRSYRGFILPYPVKGKDPVSLIETLETFANDEQLDIMAQIMQREDWLQIFFPDDKEIHTHAEWFQKFRVEFLREEEPEVTVTPPPKIKPAKAPKATPAAATEAKA